MIVSPINENEYMIKLDRYEIDVYDKDEIEKLVRTICIKLYPNKKISGILYLDIYVSKYNELIIVSKYEYEDDTNLIDIKIVFHIDTDFLYEIDNLDNINLNKFELYYYKNKLYLNNKYKLNSKEKYVLSEIGDIIIGDIVFKIKANGIRIK